MNVSRISSLGRPCAAFIALSFRNARPARLGREPGTSRTTQALGKTA